MKSQYYDALPCCKFNFGCISCFCITIFIASWSQNTFGQCNSPGSLPSLFCEDAPLACLEGSCYETVNTPFNCCNGWCGANTAIHNPQYFAFIASDENVEIHIYVDYCDNGNALQSAILDACPWDNSNVIACDPGTGPGGTMLLAASGLIPDQIYWIVVDGSSGATCGYTFTETNGIYEDFALINLAEELTFASDTFVCPGFDDLHLETGPLDIFVHGYYWVPGWSNDTITSTLPNLTIDIPHDIPDGAWEICVTAFSGCDTSNTICIPIVVSSPTLVTKGPDAFCPDFFPFIWGNEVIPGPGSYLQTFSTPEGCAYDSLWIIESYPVSEPGIIDTVICSSYFSYMGMDYTISGVYQLLIPDGDQNGCDSSIELTLHLAGFEAYVEIQCHDDTVTLVSIITDQSSAEDTMQYAWYDCTYTTLYSIVSEFSPDTSGCYCLVLDNGVCRDTICSTYALDPCMSLCNVVRQDRYCNNADVEFALTNPLQDMDSIYWRILLPDQSEIILTGEDTFTMAFTLAGIYFVSVTTRNDTTTESCLDDFQILPIAEVGICCDTLICDSCTVLSVYTSLGPVEISLLTPEGDLILDALMSSYELEVCPPPLAGATYIITDAVLSGTICPAIISDFNSATVFRAAPFQASIVPQGEMLCAFPEDMTGYTWRYCEGGGVLDFSRCFSPDTSGCYCVSILSPDGCRDTACYDFIIDNVEPAPDEANINIVPNPSSGTLNISLPLGMAFPVNWSLSDAQGKQVANGVFTASDEHINLDQHYPPGMYVLKVENPAGLIKILKVMLQ